STQMLLILKTRQGTTDAGYVFPSPRDETKPTPPPTIHAAIRNVKKASSVEFRTHDLRRTVATSLAAAGVPTPVLDKILNHVEHGVTSRHYNWHTYDQEKKA